MRFDANTIDLIKALPAPLRSHETVSAVLKKTIEKRPDWWWTPITAAECAEFLGVETSALSTARSRGKGPPCHANIPGLGVRYSSRAEVLLWAREMIGVPGNIEVPKAEELRKKAKERRVDPVQREALLRAAAAVEQVAREKL